MNNVGVETIKEKLKDILVSVVDFELSKSEIQDGEDSIRKLGLNSLALIRMLVEIEKEFDVEIDLEESDPAILSSIDNLSSHILSLKNI